MSRSQRKPRRTAGARHFFSDPEAAGGLFSRSTTDLHEERLDVVTQRILSLGARSVLDLGCGEGTLLVRLANQPQFTRIVGIDICLESLAVARSSLSLTMDTTDSRIALIPGSFTETDQSLCGFDAAVLLETIEHIDPNRLSLVENAVFRCYRPRSVCVTTPNQEYNVLHGMSPGAFRHPDHRFEWDRPRFQRWALGIASRNGYAVQFDDIGPLDPILGASTQMAVFHLAKD